MLYEVITAIRNTGGCTLIDVDPGRSTNRTVYTFVGDPESVIEGALAAAREAKERIDMRYVITSYSIHYTKLYDAMECETGFCAVDLQ